MANMSIGLSVKSCSECEKKNMAMDALNTFEWGNIFMGFDDKKKEILIEESQIMRIIQMANPAQEDRKIRLVSREELQRIRKEK